MYNINQTCISGREKVKNDAGKQMHKACNTKMTDELSTLRLTGVIPDASFYEPS
jgi:hypothetical protein